MSGSIPSSFILNLTTEFDLRSVFQLIFAEELVMFVITGPLASITGGSVALAIIPLTVSLLILMS